ncbi:MAG: DUF3108 domain-containing protein [Acidobacteria bacterium]|nr:DUF3108 domain-containing protein [Acidobacteriota bacterium]
MTEKILPSKYFRRSGRPRLALPITLLTLAVMLAGRSVIAQDQRLPFTAGEKLRYNVSWRLLPAGHAEIVLSQDRSGQGSPGRWRVVGKAQSVGYVSNIYKVDDEYQSSFRNPPLCSNGMHKVIHEGGRHRDVKLDFDAQRRVARVEEKNLQSGSNGAVVRSEQFPTPACVHDILSALYFVRTRPLTVGQFIDVPINDGSKTINLRVEVQAEEDIKTELGVMRAVRVEPAVFDGKLFTGKGRMHVWFSKDAQRVPIQLRAQIGVGTITATIAAIEREDAAR